ncbi:MAG TPA: FMN-binding protein [bacterium]|nr:FMN-binding protein [bacterium]
MEETTQNSNSTSPNPGSTSSNKFWGWFLLIAIPVGILAYILMNKEVKAPTELVITKNEQQAEIPVTKEPTIENSVTNNSEVAVVYKDGSYSSVGNYMSPGGSETVDLSLTLKDGIITDANFLPNSERPMSLRFQNQFAAGYKELVVGKKISEVNLTKVSGSSLTPKGFNDAVAQIKAKATL